MSRRKQKLNQPAPANAAYSHSGTALVLPFVQHLAELKKRFTFMALSVIAWSAAAYGVQQHITNLLIRPAHGEHFIYTSPGGGLDFLFRICLYTGLVFSLPVIVFNMLRYVEPMFARVSHGFIAFVCIASALLAAAGMFFGYIFGLPAAIHFLTHQFTTLQIKPLVTIQSYLHFVIVYMVGSAFLFQLPLILVCINRIKPLKPLKLIKYERWVILMAFILAGLMNPSPNILSQLVIAVPFIIMYQLGIVMIAVINRNATRRSQVEAAVELAVVHADTHDRRRRLATRPVLAAANRQPLLAAAALQVSKPVVAVAVMQPPTRRRNATSMDILPAKPVKLAMPKSQPKPAIATKIRPSQPLSNRPRQYVDGFSSINRQAPSWSGGFLNVIWW